MKRYRLQLGIFAVLILGIVSTSWLVINGESTTNPGGRWQPVPNLTWQWQLTGAIDTSLEVDLYDVDLFDTDKATVRELIDNNAWVICHVSVGTVEDWRPDADEFLADVVGQEYTGRPGERWLDVRQIGIVGPIIEARLDQCSEKGFDGVEADNVDGYAHDTGFDLTAEDQLAFDRWLADASHARGLPIGLKNDAEHAAELVDVFDFAVVEGCFAEGSCDAFAPFIEARKTVLAAEYTDSGLDFAAACEQAKAMELSLILKERDLGPWVERCPEE